MQLGVFPACVFDEDAAHGFGGRGEEMAAAIPLLCLLRVHQAEVGFVDQGRGLERLARPLLRQLPAGQFAQLLIDQRQ